jgi:hypothetical protein
LTILHAWRTAALHDDDTGFELSFGRAFESALSGVGLSILDNLTRLEESRLHDDHAGFELSFGRTLQQLIDFFLHLLADLLLSTFLAYRAGNILDFHEVGL